MSTSIFRVVEAKQHHLGRILRTARSASIGTVMALGVDPHAELTRVFGESSFRRSWMIDGQLAAIGGVTGSLASSAGYVWLVFGDLGTAFPRAALREARDQLTVIGETFGELRTKVDAADRVAMRFASYLGFRPVAGSAQGGMVEMMRGADAPFGRSPRSGPFFIHGLPRSRTYWLSEFLTYGGNVCHHDLPIKVDGVDEFFEVLGRPGVGTAETGLTGMWPVLDAEFPAARIVVVRRPIADVKASLARFDWQYGDGELEGYADRLDEISMLPGAISVTFDELDTEDGCRRVFEHCLGVPFDADWWWLNTNQNMQIDMAERVALIERRAAHLNEFFLMLLARRFPITIQAEPFEDFYRDGAPLFKQHYAEAGAIDGLPLDPNVEMARTLESVGQLLIMTARLSHVLVGYLVFMISPSFESRGVLLGYQSMFYVMPAFRGGTGLRLHAAARDALRAKRVKILVLRSGTRASGPKLQRLFNRIGTVDMGSLHYLTMED